MAVSLNIKGIKDGLLVAVGEGDWSEASQAIIARLQESGEFFRGARLILQLSSGYSLGAAELGKLRDELGELHINLWTVLSESALTENAARALGLEVRLPKQQPLPADLPPLSPAENGGEAILVEHTVRSGRSVRYPGHVVIIGDVNAGAEVIAGGNVVVWGRVRGTVQAGSANNDRAVVCALDLAPTQLRIGSAIATSPKRRGRPEPEMARVRDGQIVAERWKPNEREK